MNWTDTDVAWDLFCKGTIKNEHHYSNKTATATSTSTSAIVSSPLSASSSTLSLSLSLSASASSSSSFTSVDSLLSFEDSCAVPTTDVPLCSALHISTKTNISFLDRSISLKDTFWKIPVSCYYLPGEGVVKKQMKFNSSTKEELSNLLKEQEDEVNQHKEVYLIKQASGDLLTGVGFKDVRKISIGLCKKDLSSYRGKKKSAFYNCFVVILRLLYDDMYREVHVKVFNTGKLEIPGIQDDRLLQAVLVVLLRVLTPLMEPEQDTELGTSLRVLSDKSETVLINSNFNCGYYINREKLFEILKYKYNINSNYDPCSYPGIQCEFYNDTLNEIQNGMQPSSERNVVGNITRVSFMIFRTGSVLIVGKCNEPVLYKIYEFICQLFQREYPNIVCQNNVLETANRKQHEIMMKEKGNHSKLKRKTISV